ncbi:uncharacterized protein K452DRAFT_40791 [Aplosporella prunicola CBS 121167]|uniref:Major facilitator superfamily (MFS) profile domain-containing protein n=1 Tax=Aplosporella prunicola CBS 121167 TaxID=1176127 RepID=A0A6A6AUH6_9PEZI|nr:uncharacterized protein K452DRAFT_40791 [Aplosporella prunicola CBS 121167]KAF2135256.1 hypothetical protein K452DRAFT_40791 [Aplosporella prunicola CBS 121167]
MLPDIIPETRDPSISSSRVSQEISDEAKSFEGAGGGILQVDQPFPSIGGGKPFPPQISDPEAYAVDFDGPNDPLSPYTWSTTRKFFTACIVCFGTFVASFDSALFAAGIKQASAEFNVSNEVGILGTSLYVLGFAFGPLVWAPGSELIGRRWPIIVGMFGCSIFTVASATAKDIQTLIICRFFSGVFGASPLCIVPGVLVDIYSNVYRGVAITLYSLTVFTSPFAAPFIGGFVSASVLRWRWTLYLPALLGFLDTLLLLVFLEETFAPFLLVEKASRIRKQTNNWAIHAAQEKVEFDLRRTVRNYFTRPLRMLLTEPIVLLVSLYMSFIYGLVYCLLEAYPYVFEEVYGMSPGVGGLPFIGLIIGILLSLVFILSQHGDYVKKLAANDNVPVPEWRLPPVIVGAFVFTAGLFWFAWTAYTPIIHWMAPTASGVLVGFGLLCIYLPCFNYLVDSYLHLAASAVAANIMLRSSIAAGFPLFSRQMFANLGVQWAGTLLGCLAAVMIPIPIAFKIYGPAIRARSKMSA